MSNILDGNLDLFTARDVGKLSGIPYGTIYNFKRRGIIVPTRYNRYTISQIIWMIVFYNMSSAYSKNSCKTHKKLVGLDFSLNTYEIKNHDVLLLSEKTKPMFSNLSEDDKTTIDLNLSKMVVEGEKLIWFKTEMFYHIFLYKIKDGILKRFENNRLRHNVDVNRLYQDV